MQVLKKFLDAEPKKQLSAKELVQGLEKVLGDGGWVDWAGDLVEDLVGDDSEQSALISLLAGSAA